MGQALAALFSIGLGLIASAAFAFCGAGILAVVHMFDRMRSDGGSVWGKLVLCCYSLVLGGVCIASSIGLLFAPNGENAIKSAEGYYLGFVIGCFLVWRYIKRQD